MAVMTAKGEKPLETETWVQHENAALESIDAAGLALSYAQTLHASQYGRAIHEAFYEHSGLNPRELEHVKRIGVSTMENAQASASVNESGSKRVPNRIALTSHLLKAMEAYKSIDPNKVFNRKRHQEFNQTLDRFEDPETQIAAGDIKDALESFGKLLDESPFLGDICVITGLSILRLGRFLSNEDIRQRIAHNPGFTNAFRATHPLQQASLLVGSQFVSQIIEARAGTVRNTLLDTLSSGAGVSHPEHAKAVNEALVELDLVEQILAHNKTAGKKPETFLGATIASALSRASAWATLLSDAQPRLEELHAGAPADELVSREAAIVQATKNIKHKAHTIIAETLKLNGHTAKPLEYIGLNQFPDIMSPISNFLEQQEAAKRAGELAAARALQEATLRELRAELDALLADYTVGRSSIKNHPYGRQVSSMLVTGKYEKKVWDGPQLSKDDAFNATGLIISLETQLNNRQNTEIFGRLFDVVQREKTIREQLGKELPMRTIGKPTAWMLENIMHLRRSDMPILRRIGDGLAAYRLAQQTSSNPSVRPTRNVSVETLHRIEQLRSEAAQLDIQAFPPGRVNVNALVEDLHAKIGEYSPQTGQQINELRFLLLDNIADFLLQQGYQERDIQFFRLLPGSLRQKVPYYVLVLTLSNRKIVVAENPKEPNATFVFEEFDAKAATWQELVQLDKDTIKQFGGRGMRHVTELSLDYHTERVQEEVIKRLLSE